LLSSKAQTLQSLRLPPIQNWRLPPGTQKEILRIGRQSQPQATKCNSRFSPKVLRLSQPRQRQPPGETCRRFHTQSSTLLTKHSANLLQSLSPTPWQTSLHSSQRDSSKLWLQTLVQLRQLLDWRPHSPKQSRRLLPARFQACFGPCKPLHPAMLRHKREHDASGPLRTPQLQPHRRVDQPANCQNQELSRNQEQRSTQVRSCWTLKWRERP